MMGSIASTGIFLHFATQQSLQPKCYVPPSASLSSCALFSLPQYIKFFPYQNRESFFGLGNSCIIYKWPRIFFRQHPLAGHLVWLQSCKNTSGTLHHAAYLMSQVHGTLSFLDFFFPSCVSTDISLLIFILQTYNLPIPSVSRLPLLSVVTFLFLRALPLSPVGRHSLLGSPQPPRWC